jgi:hypothetical protein
LVQLIGFSFNGSVVIGTVHRLQLDMRNVYDLLQAFLQFSCLIKTFVAQFATVLILCFVALTQKSLILKFSFFDNLVFLNFVVQIKTIA